MDQAGRIFKQKGLIKKNAKIFINQKRCANRQS